VYHRTNGSANLRKFRSRPNGSEPATAPSRHHVVGNAGTAQSFGGTHTKKHSIS